MKYLKLMRVKHYFKNFLVFLPVVFGMKIFDLSLDIYVFMSFLSFSFMASVIYILNDIKDVEKDRQHPKKCNRPIANGSISKRKALLFAAVLMLLSIVFNIVALHTSVSYIQGWVLLVSYFGVNVVYSILNGKNVPLLDVVLLVSGFIIRVYYGSAVSGIPVSMWMSLVICAGAFYMGFGKRRNELTKITGDTRDVLKYYSESFLEHAMNCCMTLSITFYSLWVLTIIQEGRSGLFIWSIPLLMIILFRYSMDVEDSRNNALGDPIEVLLSDKILILIVICFIIFLGLCLYIFG